MDHRKGVRDDNRWKEIRHVTNICNSQNQKIRTDNTSGFNGVFYNRRLNKWIAGIKIHNKSIYLGQHDDIISAALARCTFEMHSPDWTCNYRAINFIKLRALGYKI